MMRFVAAMGVLVLLACGQTPTVPAGSPVAVLQLVSGGDQEGVAGYLLADPVIVRVLDASDRPLPFVAVRASVGDPFARVTAGSAITDANGLARFEWRLGLALGPQQLLVSVPDATGPDPLGVGANSRSNAMRAIGGGIDVMCGIDGAGTLGCWQPSHDPDHPPTFTPHPTAGRFTVLAISPGLDRPMDGCAIAEDGRIWCFAVSPAAEITALSELPGSYPALVALTGGGSAAATWCGLSADGTAWCWGNNQSGLLGDGGEDDRDQPTPVATAVRFTRLAVGSQHACGIAMTASVWCWGGNATAQVGKVATPTPFLTPVRLASDLQFATVAIPHARVSCAVERGSGFPWCWGDKTLLGVSASTVSAIEGDTSPAPLYVESLAGVIAIGRVDAATVVLRRGGAGAWWGDLSPTRDVTLAAVPQSFVTTIEFGSLAIPHASGVLCGTPADADAPLCVRFGSITGYETTSFAGFGMPFP